jgi:hypothetical protein
MRVMVSLNLADIMTGTRAATPQLVNETPINEADRVDSNQESRLPVNSEQMKSATESIE